MRPDPPFTLRPAQPGDRAALIALNRELQAAEQALRSSRIPPEAVPDSYVDDLLRREAGGDGGVVVALEGAVAAGFAAWRAETDPLEIDPPEVRITDLVVAPAHRRRGVARALVAHVVGRAAARGATRVLVATLTGNRPALALYGAMRFRPLLATLELPVEAEQPEGGGRPP
jgi:ribosomal protein S18 acetylase RimI-like enzyme